MPSPHKYVAKSGKLTWRVRFRAHNPLGELLATSETFDTERQADDFCKLIEAIGADAAVEHLEQQRESAALPTVTEWVDKYITMLTGIEEGTKVEYRRLYNRTWKPLIGKHRLGALTREHVAGAVNDLATRLSDKSIANAWGSVLAPAIREAHEEGLIEKNPCRKMRLPRNTEHEKVEHRYLSYAEFDQLLEATPQHWRPLVITLAGTGMRWGEVEVLTIGDLRLDDPVPVIRIIKASKWSGVQKRRTGPPKSPKSRRSVALPPEVVDALRPLTKGRAHADRVFIRENGDAVKHDYFWKMVWRPMLKEAGLDEPQPRIHDLRHTHVAWLIALGIRLEVIQARLGHESIKTTIDEYGHLMPDLLAAAAHAASVAFSQVKSLGSSAETTAIGP